MNRVLRTYAQTAWTPSDPLAGLEAQQRFAILLMTPTWRERLKLGPWRGREERRRAMLEVIAERRLLYELTFQRHTALSPVEPVHPTSAPMRTASPFFEYRLAQHRATLHDMAEQRVAEDRTALATSAEAQKLSARHTEIRKRLRSLEIEKARLHLEQLELDDEPVMEM